MRNLIQNTFRMAVAAFVLAGPIFAQGPKGPNPAAPATGQALINMAAAATMNGKITAVQVAFGAQYPSITIDGKTIKVAPVWFLLENEFELAAGDEVSVLAAPSARAGDPSLYAISITKTASGASLTMRNEAGVPLWTMPGIGGGMANANGYGIPAAPRQNQGTGCLDASTIAEVKGTVDAVTQGAGIQQPQLTLVASGKSVTVKIGPERILLAADIELKTGMTLTVRYATATCTGELIALSLTTEDGARVLLRNDDGTPAWN